MRNRTDFVCRTVQAILVLLLGGSTASSSWAQDVQVDLALVAAGFTSPVVLMEAPDESGRLFVADQTGQIWIITADGIRMDQPFLNLADSLVELRPGYDERGLLGLAFHPEYAENGQFYVYYSMPLREDGVDSFDHTNRLSRFHVSTTDPNVAEPDSERVLIELDWPYANHNGGSLAFGPDSMLYVSLGDGGNRDDTDRNLTLGHVEDWYGRNRGGNGQDIEDNLLGSILRVNVDEGENESGEHTHSAEPLSIPEDNPFVEIPGVPAEQWAYGFRNPWRMSFDIGGDHDLIVGDVGQEMFEEISVVTRGGNFGWNVMEGNACFNASSPENPFDDCPDEVGESHPMMGDPLVRPVLEQRNPKVFEGGEGLAIIGGHVFRGDALPPVFDGTYFFGQWSGGEEETEEGEVHFPGALFAATPQDNGTWPWTEVEIANADSFPHFILAFGQDLAGNVFVLTSDEEGPSGNTGKVYKIIEEGTAGLMLAGERDAELPRLLSLDQNYPNPFNPETMIRFKTGTSERVTLRIYDGLGREVATLLDNVLGPGVHSVTWNATDGSGRPLPSGVYMYRATSRSGSDAKLMTLLR